jgi:hypothetical protein
MERIRQYQEMNNLPPDNYSFSEKALVTFYQGAHREVLKYMVHPTKAYLV